MNFISQQFDYNNERLVSCYDEAPLWSVPFGKVLLQMVEYRKSITALDIGFGTGFPFLELAMRLGASSLVYGIDPWSSAVKRTKLKAEQYSIDNIRIIEGSATNIPIDDNTVDLIISNNGLNNIPQLFQVAKECYRIARHDCQFIMTMNLDKTMSEFYDIFKKSFLENGLEEYIVNIDKHIQEKRPQISEVIRILKDVGFNKTKEVHDNFSYTFSTGTALLNHYFLRLAFIDSWVKCIPQGYQKKIMDDVENRINHIAECETGFSLSIPLVCLEFRKRGCPV